MRGWSHGIGIPQAWHVLEVPLWVDGHHAISGKGEVCMEMLRLHGDALAADMLNLQQVHVRGGVGRGSATCPAIDAVSLRALQPCIHQ
eukprot:49223-Chlamydomonas_euryale.AAC.7